MKSKLKIREVKKCFFKFYSPLCLFVNSYVDDIEVSKKVVQDVFFQLYNDNPSFNDAPSFLIKNRLDWLLFKCLEHKAVKQKASVVPINASTIREAFIWYCRICKNAKK